MEQTQQQLEAVKKAARSRVAIDAALSAKVLCDIADALIANCDKL